MAIASAFSMIDNELAPHFAAAAARSRGAQAEAR